MVLGLGAKGAAPPGDGFSVKTVLPSVSRHVRGLKEVSGAMRGVKDTLYHTWRHGLLYTSYHRYVCMGAALRPRRARVRTGRASATAARRGACPEFQNDNYGTHAPGG